MSASTFSTILPSSGRVSWVSLACRYLGPLNNNSFFEQLQLYLLKKAALLYGDVLLTNRKYKFGILSLEGALVNLQQRNKFGEQRRSIERKLAVIAYDQKDWYDTCSSSIH